MINRHCIKYNQKIKNHKLSNILKYVKTDFEILLKKRDFILIVEKIPFIRISPLGEVPPIYHDWLSLSCIKKGRGV